MIREELFLFQSIRRLWGLLVLWGMGCRMTRKRGRGVAAAPRAHMTISFRVVSRDRYSTQLFLSS